MRNQINSARLKRYQIEGLLRKRLLVESRDSQNMIIINGQPLINFASNDYLNIASHNKIKAALMQGVSQYGFGSSSSALVSGYYKSHQLLEERFAEFLQRDAALLFNSGYHANLGVITTLANRQNSVISDKLCHASLLDGIQLARAKHYRYRHNDIKHAEKLLQQTQQPSLLITESVFSMTGNLSPAPQLAALARNYNSLLLIDDAHGIGVLGRCGRGISEYFNLSKQEIFCLISPLGKAFGGLGAIVSGDQALIEELLQFARTYRYTTALSPAITFAMLATLKIVEVETWRRERLLDLIAFFIRQACHRALPLISTDLTPIKSILIGNSNRVMQIQTTLMKHGFFTAGIRPPTVPSDTARIRISLNCMHTENDIMRLLDLIADNHDSNSSCK